ncbi:unnamed protein product [Ectocarpus sp. CCAP 1310/34]|nr:unnamed protein product [Ectocarpus sp. CCAP 1310/34]
MAERGKRQDPTDPAPQRWEKRRRRAIDEDNAAQEDKRFTVLGLLRAVVVATGVVAAGEAHRAHCPQERTGAHLRAEATSVGPTRGGPR